MLTRFQFVWGKVDRLGFKIVRFEWVGGEDIWQKTDFPLVKLCRCLQWLFYYAGLADVNAH